MGVNGGAGVRAEGAGRKVERRDPGYNPERRVPRFERYRAARRDPSLVVIEGLHALRHAMRFGAEPFEVLTEDTEELARLAEELAPDVAPRIIELAEPIDPQELARLTPAPVHTRVIALAPRPEQELAAALASPSPAPVVFLEDPADTYNLGAVVRVAAAGEAAALLVSGKHDPWNPGSVRTAAGLSSRFRARGSKSRSCRGPERLPWATAPSSRSTRAEKRSRRAVSRRARSWPSAANATV